MAPAREVDLPLRSIDPGFAERDGKTDRRVQQQIVIGKVVHGAKVAVYIQTDLAHEGLRHSGFVVVAVRRLHGKVQHVGIQDHHAGRAGQQYIFKRRRLENPVISGVNQQFMTGEVARNSQAGADCVLIDDKLVVVPADPCADGPITEANQILNEGGLLEIWSITNKAEPSWRAGVELGGVGDDVGEFLVQENVVRLDTDLPLLFAAVDGNRSFEIRLGKVVALKGNDGRGQQIRRQAVGVVAKHASKIADNVRRENVLVGDDPDVFEDVAILPLASGLLHLLVRYVKAGQFVAVHQAQTIARGKVALIVTGEITQGPIVRIVLWDGRTQIAARHRAVGADAEGVLSPQILEHGVSAGGIEATSGQDKLAVETVASVPGGVDLDDAAHLPSVLGRNTGGINAHRLNTVGFNLGPIPRRTVVGERNAVEHKLGLVFRPARMEDCVAFIEPSRLRVHQVLQGAARQRGDAIGNCVRADLIDCTNAMRINEGVVFLHLYGCLKRNQS